MVSLSGGVWLDTARSQGRDVRSRHEVAMIAARSGFHVMKRGYEWGRGCLYFDESLAEDALGLFYRYLRNHVYFINLSF